MQDRVKIKLNARDIQKKIDCGEIKVVYTRSSRREVLSPWVKRVLEAAGRPEAFVTARSTIGDFIFGVSIDELSEKLGVKVLLRDRVDDVASRIRRLKYKSMYESSRVEVGSHGG